MDELSLKTFVCGQLYNNCYLVFDNRSKKAFIVDYPLDSPDLNDFIKTKRLEVLFIALTHGHFDHIQGLSSCKYPFYIHREDAMFLTDSKLNGSQFFEPSFIVERKPKIYGQSLDFDKYKIEVIPTPGHTPGSVSLKINSWLFSGDALFFNSVGRTDIALASHEQLITAIKTKILALAEDTFVYPGHGPSTTVGREKKENPFLT